MKCLVTGGAGFIGSHLVESLLKDGHYVTIIDDLSTGRIENLDNLIDNSNLEFIEGDIINLPELEYLVQRSDIVYHLAAAVGVELVVSDPVRTIITNVHGTENILKGAARKGTRVLVASTSEVYGKSDKDVFSEENDLLIGPSTHSRWSYACSKLLDEFYSMAFYRANKLPIIITRFFNTVGPRQTGRYGMVIPRFVENAIEGKNLQVYGTGEQTRCFCHVYDSIKAIRLLAESDISGQVFNIGSNYNISINSLAKYIIDILGSKSRIEHVSYDKAYEEGFEDMLHRFPDLRKTKEHINWEPGHTLSDIVHDVADYYMARLKIQEN